VASYRIWHCAGFLWPTLVSQEPVGEETKAEIDDEGKE